MELNSRRPIRITCARELGEHLRAEVEALGYEVLQTHMSTALELEGNLADAMRLNMHLRTAFSVQLELARFSCEDGDQLYDAVNALAWEDLIAADGYLSVISKVNTPSVNNSMFPSLKVKDAVCDRINEVMRERPDAGPRRDRTVLTLHWHGKHATLYLDTSGEKLSDRGYRQRMVAAPMRETLAAAILHTTGYTGETPLVNPMCGSGTLAIEAALIATRRAPGLLRNNFGFKHVTPFDAEAWQALRKEARAQVRDAPAPIIASDSDPKAVEAARANAVTAGVDRWIQFEVCDFAETTVPPGPGVVVLNPPYGKRLSDNATLEPLYKGMGDFFKKTCKGYFGYVFTANLDLAKKLGLRANQRTTFVNGELECRLLRYEIYAGSKKQKKQPGAD